MNEQEEIKKLKRNVRFWKILYLILAIVAFILLVTTIYQGNLIVEYDNIASQCLDGFNDTLHKWATCEGQRLNMSFDDIFR